MSWKGYHSQWTAAFNIDADDADSESSEEELRKFVDSSKLSHIVNKHYISHEFTLFEYCMLVKNCGILNNILTDVMSKYSIDDKYDSLMYFKPIYEKRGLLRTTNLYNKLEDRNEFIIKQISFLISQYSINFEFRTNKNYSHNGGTDGMINNSFSNNLRKVVKNSIPILHENIIDIIVNQYIGLIQWLKPAEFGRKVLNNKSIHNDFKYPLQFENNNTIFRYPLETLDGIYIPSNFMINLELETECLYIFHIYMISKGDEIHIGLKSKAKFQLEYTYYFRRKDDLMCYYGGRENDIETADNEYVYQNGWDSKYGAIQGLSQVVQPKIDSYRSGDFISIMIYVNKSDAIYTIVFFKNGKAVTHPINIAQLKTYNDLILFGNVDYDNDAMYIEQALYSDQLKF